MMLPFQTADQNYPSIEMVNPVTNQLRLLGPLLEEPRQFVHPSFWSSLAWQRNATIDEVQQDRAVHNAAANFERFCQLESTRDSVP